MFARSQTLLKTTLAGVVLLWGCADLALEADRIPAELVISPDRGLLESGKSVDMTVVVTDQGGDAMRIPGWAPPVWRVSDETVAELSPRDRTLTATGAGRVVVAARLGGLTAEACFHIDADPLLLTAPVIYVTQAAQNRDNTTLLIAGRPALIRIFMVGDRTSFLAPSVQVTLLQDDKVVFEKRVQPLVGGIPTGVDESDLSGSFDVEVSGLLVQPGLRMVVELDPECVVPLARGSRVRYPDVGSTELLVVEPQLFRQVFVPTLWIPRPDYSVFDWLDGISPDSEQMRYTRNLLPVSEMEIEVRDTFRTNADLRTYRGWDQWLNEIRVMNIQEGRRGYYYGVIGSAPGGLLGLAAFTVPWSVGVDNADTYTHEIGHNMDLRHAPCGGAGGPDPDYPYSTGSIGIWGYDVETKELHDPAGYRDLMSYCDPVWISDYQFDRATAHRLGGDGGVDPDGGSSMSLGEMLVVWGSVRDGELTLDPAFVLEGPVELPEADGPYRVEGLGAGGETMFSLSFTPTPLEHGGGGFAYFIPYEPEWADNLDRMVLTGPEGEYTVTRDSEPGMAVLTDRSTGRIRAIIRNWDGGPLPGEETADVTITMGIPAGGLR